jgi:hypothetical protein
MRTIGGFMAEESTPTNDTSEVTPQEPAVEIVDTSTSEPEGGIQAPAPTEPQTQELILGKYASVEDLANAHQEAERKMHEATQEASRYREQFEQSRSAPPPHYPAQPNTEEMNEKFRQSLENQPFETLVALADQRAEAKFQNYIAAKEERDKETYRQFREFSSKEGYGDVADSVAKDLPFAKPANAVEASFMRERIKNLEAQVRQGVTAGTTTTALNQRRERAFVEPGTGSGTADVTRIEIDGDARKFRSMFPGMSDEEYRSVVIDAAKNRANRDERMGRSMGSALSQAHDERVITDYEVKK